MQDDVANAEENPYPGKLFNKPTAAGEPGVDVYKVALAETSAAPPPSMLPCHPHLVVTLELSCAILIHELSCAILILWLQGCKPTYTGEVVTAKLFLDVLQGKSSDTAHTVLKSTAKDSVCTLPPHSLTPSRSLMLIL